jgi:hypothetical protein
MGWKDLLQQNEDRNLVYPWVGGRSIRTKNRSWKLEGQLPDEHGWYNFDARIRTATALDAADFPDNDMLTDHVTGYLVGNRIVADDIAFEPKAEDLVSGFERVFLIEPGIDKFARIKAGRACENGPLIFEGEEFPLGSEDDVLNAFLDQKESVDDIPGVTPALEAAFRFECHVRAEIERRRREEEERRRLEEERRQVRERLGDGSLRRNLAQRDFAEAARAALAVGGATFLDHRRGHANREMIVRYRLNNMRLECTCDERTLRIIDSGICLTAEYSDEEFDSGTRGDSWFTLESLPGVVLQAQRERRLNIYRHG